LFRIPYSKYWNLADSHHVEIVKFQDTYVTIDDVDSLWNYLAQYDKAIKVEKRALQGSNGAKYRNFSNMNIQDVVKKINALH